MRGEVARIGLRQHFIGLRFAKRADCVVDGWVLVAQHGGGQQGCIGGARFADGQGSHWNTGGHLRDRKQRVHAV